MKIVFIPILLVIVAACTHTQESTEQLMLQKINKKPLEKLHQRYQLWQETPYKLGGNSKQGIDCSGFVALTFDEEFNTQLPRTTLKQSKLENEIAIGQLQAGDLIFFKIIEKIDLRHVGIYLENNKFLHASTSKGVTISDLDSDYWSKNYWKSIRVLKH
jgi:cell wall-associated NlpC family hydrolase